MEREVFRHGGTLDKYLGDGLMATFGTPSASDSDAGNALRCAQAMIASIGEFNRERKNRGEPPIRVSVGLHYGEVVLGDIGLNRLEFAVIGTAVNAASRLESLTRELGCAMVASDDLVRQARAEASSSRRRLRASCRAAATDDSRSRATGRHLDVCQHQSLMPRIR